jgi:DNA polymerase-3 subunit alpha
MADFVHLHVHSQYSMLDSALRLKALVKSAKQDGMPAVALTDHGNMFGAVQFHAECKKHDVQPIIGCELNVCTDRAGHAREASHLVVLARSQRGYQNLVKLQRQAARGFRSTLGPSRRAGRAVGVHGRLSRPRGFAKR